MPRSISEVNALRNSVRATEAQQPPPRGPHGGRYDPNQPRAPAGHDDGGQWTNKPGGSPSSPRRDVTVDHSGKESWGSFANAYRPDGSLAEQRVFNRDGSRFVSEFNEPGSGEDWDERHTVVLTDGSKVTFETTGNIQRIYDGDGRLISASVWTKDGPQPLSDQIAFAPAAGVAIAPELVAGLTPAAIAAGAALFAWLARSNRRGIVIAFSRDESDPGKKPRTMWLGKLTDEELKKACPRYPDVQAFTDKAAAGARLWRSDWRPSDFGTEVHTRVARDVTGTYKNGQPRPLSDPKDPDFRAEYSALKSWAASSPPPAAKYGQKDTVRIDVLENKQDEGTVCVYDIKTGEKIFAPLRMEEIARSVYHHYPNTQRFIVTEVRPQM
jgi:hypothetical protein